MSMLQRLTTQYNQVEDRIRISGEDAEGKVQVLWFNQRLLNRLVPSLCQGLERTGTGAAAGAGAQAELRHSFEQQVARANHVAEPPVQAPPDSPGWLVVTVNVTGSADGVVRLQFVGAQRQTAEITFGEMALRQWLAILQDQYRAGQWPTQVFPGWMEPSAAPAPSAAVLH